LKRLFHLVQNKIFFEPSPHWQVILLANLPPWCENHLLEWWVFERSLCITTRRICRKGGRKAKFAIYSKHCTSCNKHYMFGIQKLMFVCPIMVWRKELQMATFITFMKVIKFFLWSFIYVDGIYFIGNHDTKIQWIKIEIKKKFEMVDLGLLTHSLWLEYFFQLSGIIVTQRG
jgi:hypothetical protein